MGCKLVVWFPVQSFAVCFEFRIKWIQQGPPWIPLISQQAGLTVFHTNMIHIEARWRYKYILFIFHWNIYLEIIQLWEYATRPTCTWSKKLTWRETMSKLSLKFTCCTFQIPWGQNNDHSFTSENKQVQHTKHKHYNIMVIKND